VRYALQWNRAYEPDVFLVFSKGKAMPVQYRPRVLMIVHDPWIIPDKTRLHQHMGWHDPYVLAQQYIADIHTASHGLVAYQIVRALDAPWFPAKIDGFRYTSETFLRQWATQAMHQPDALDYRKRIEQFDLLTKLARDEYDEVWVFSFPYAGEYESVMIGPTAFWCNAPPIICPDAVRNTVMMGFNYERDVGCMLENFGHRVESIMAHTYQKNAHLHNLWEEFIRYDLTSPGAAACGNVHYAPNSTRDYEWGRSGAVLSSCDRFLDYPASANAPARRVTAAEWGGGDMRAHHIWWLKHLPHRAERSAGEWGNWWRTVLLLDEDPLFAE
jgi:hypothetical protein